MSRRSSDGSGCSDQPIEQRPATRQFGTRGQLVRSGGCHLFGSNISYARWSAKIVPFIPGRNFAVLRNQIIGRGHAPQVLAFPLWTANATAPYFGLRVLEASNQPGRSLHMVLERDGQLFPGQAGLQRFRVEVGGD